MDKQGIPPEYKSLQVAAIRVETTETKSFVLEETDGQPLMYKAGQFLTLIFPNKTGKNRRSYSISSNPELGEPLTITVKRIANGEFSRILIDDVKVGDQLLTIGASGFFTLPDPVNEQHTYLFFAAGSGITPILPLVKSLLYNSSVKVFLAYSSHSRDTTIFYQELVQLQQRYENRFVLDFLFSTNKNLRKARLSKELVRSYVAQHVAERKTDVTVYLCGPPDYMQMVSISLISEGIPAMAVKKEIFDPVKSITKELPPDQDLHYVTIRSNNSLWKIPVQYPTTILKAAEQHGIPLPYSCEAGKCGTCAATCVEGQVWMSYNEVLTDNDLNAGRVLTCVGHPIKSDVVLEFPPLL